MKAAKNITQENRCGRKTKFSTEEERRQSILESKRKWARKNLSKNKDEESAELELFAIHKTSDGTTSNIYKLKQSVKDEKDLVENESLKEKILAKDRENELLRKMVLTKDTENESLKEIIELLKTNNLLSKYHVNQSETCEKPKTMVSIYPIKECKESFEDESPAQYLSSDEDESSEDGNVNRVEKVDEVRVISEEEIKKYKQIRKKRGDNFNEHDWDIEGILADRSRDPC